VHICNEPMLNPTLVINQKDSNYLTATPHSCKPLAVIIKTTPTI